MGLVLYVSLKVINKNLNAVKYVYS